MVPDKFTRPEKLLAAALACSLSFSSARAGEPTFELPNGLTVEMHQVGAIVQDTFQIEMTVHSTVDTSVQFGYEAAPWGGGKAGTFLYVLLIDGVGEVVPKFVGEMYGPQYELAPRSRKAEAVKFQFAGLRGKDPERALIYFVWVERKRHGSGSSGVIELR